MKPKTNIVLALTFIIIGISAAAAAYILKCRAEEKEARITVEPRVEFVVEFKTNVKSLGKFEVFNVTVDSNVVQRNIWRKEPGSPLLTNDSPSPISTSQIVNTNIQVAWPNK